MTKLWLVLAALLYGTLIALALRPAFDLEAARAFYAGHGHFVGDTRLGSVARYTAWAAPFVLFAGLLLAAGGARLGIFPARWAPSARGLVFLASSLLIGPGLLVHTTLKPAFHRPRPFSVAAFGGPDAFVPFYRADGACGRNCSFPSAETAIATWTLAPASLVPPPWRALALAGALVFAAGTGLLRMTWGDAFPVGRRWRHAADGGDRGDPAHHAGPARRRPALS